MENLAEKAEEEIKARDPKGKGTEIAKPLEEAKKVYADNKKLLGEIREEREKYEQAHVEALLSGKAEAGSIPVEKTQDDKDQETADKMIEGFK